MSDDMRPFWPGDFKVGDRVRVRLSGECNFAGHCVEQMGIVGTVEGVYAAEGGHPHLVVFDVPIQPKTTLHTRLVDMFAATELEPLA